MATRPSFHLLSLGGRDSLALNLTKAPKCLHPRRETLSVSFQGYLTVRFFEILTVLLYQEFLVENLIIKYILLTKINFRADFVFISSKIMTTLLIQGAVIVIVSLMSQKC